MKPTDFARDLAKKLADMLPANLSILKTDLEKNFRACLENVFARLDLVTREEFDTQTRVLARAREQLAALEKIIQAYELEKNTQRHSEKNKEEKKSSKNK